jgi:hypothetical protein|tara:strand:+ start:3458 stop:4231 length:774 start_codon:yes stop_codon:yes gene_type:complete
MTDNIDVTAQQRPDDRAINASFLYCGHAILDHKLCETIIDFWGDADYTEVTYPNEGDVNTVMPVNEEDNDRLKYADVMGRDIYVIGETNPHFEEVEEIIREVLPATHDFDVISYMSIIAYPTGTCMPMHIDDADSNDSGTCVINLNDNFRGGDFVIDDHIIKPYTGNVIAFNNSTQRWHGVNPVLMGERFSLCVWFQNPHEQQDEQGEMSLKTGKVVMGNDDEQTPEHWNDNGSDDNQDNGLMNPTKPSFNNVILPE